MGEIYLKNFIGGSVVYVFYHALAFIPFFRAAALFEISSMLYYFIAIPLFAFINASVYILLKSRYKKWKLALNFLLLFLISNLLLGRVPLDSSIPISSNPYMDDLLYWLRWFISFLPLLFINYLYSKFANWQKIALLSSPFAFLLFIFILLQFPQ